MSNKQLTDYSLPQNAYVAFDALTLKDYIISRLDKNEFFTDQVYEGSNLSSIIDIIAFSYHVLLFYLNDTASESTFSQAALYENMNKIVNLVGYKPTGKQTAICTLDTVGSDALPIGNYYIRKFSYFLVDDIQYTFIKDYFFSKTTSADEPIESLNNNVILYQGTVQEYPTYTAAGEEYETLPIVVTNIVDREVEKFISTNTICVYVKEKESGLFKEYTEVDNLYISGGDNRVYDIRLNENGNYEVKFGNGVFGRQLQEGDEVVVYYILSDNVAGVISANAIDGDKLFNYTTSQFETIYSNISQVDSTLITNTNSANITFRNPTNSTFISNAENVDQIRQNVPKFVSANLRLVTSADYTNYLNKELSNISQSIYVASNKEFIDTYIKYFYDISVDPAKVNRVLINQSNFADSCDFNNVNVFCVPKFNSVNLSGLIDYMPNSLKNIIVDKTQGIKMIGAEVVPRDPVYITFRIGVTNQQQYSSIVADNCKLIIVRESANKVNKETLKNRVTKIITDFFALTNNKLNGTINISKLTSDILSVAGIKTVRTYNSTENINFKGISFIAWNPQYESDDIEMINQDTSLPFFKFPYLNNPNTIGNFIEVEDE